ncbi:MAG: FkbM family methyltransferase [Sphingosinicella sp.]|uniref:FkbM family methyltransferase n=1 Tax=Sphingosinicella sp. TaxID=1917971 RepID=UPI0040384D61
MLRYLLAHPLAGRRPLTALARLAAWQVRSRLRAGPHQVRWISGTTLVVHRGMWGATGNLYLGLHEFGDMAFVLHMLREDDLFVDVGANVGTYTVLAAGVRGARCHAFEPDPLTAAHLAANLASNGIEDKVAVHVMALGHANGEIGFTIGLDTVNRVASAGEPQRLVPVRRLDDVLVDQVPVLIKIDVEGHEDSVFAGAEATLADSRLLAIETESAGPVSLELFARLGFRRRYYNPFKRVLTSEPNSWPDNNRLYVRGEAEIMDRLRDASPIEALGLRF